MQGVKDDYDANKSAREKRETVCGFCQNSLNRKADRDLGEGESNHLSKF